MESHHDMLASNAGKLTSESAAIGTPTTASVEPSVTSTPTASVSESLSPSTWLLWQFLDSALPTGGFIASNGLEAFAKLYPEQTSPREVEEYIDRSVHSCAYTNLPFVDAIWRLMDRWIVLDQGPKLKNEGDKQKMMERALHRIANIDREYHVFMNNSIQNAASRKQGDGILMMGVKCFADQISSSSSSPSSPDTGSRDSKEDDFSGLGSQMRILKQFKAMIRRDEVAGHYPIAYAIIARLLGFDLATTRQLHLHLHARTLLSSAVRLALIGPFQAQHIMTRSQTMARYADLKTKNLTIEEAAQTFLVGDICSGVHGRLWTRLFNS
ncbi:hypothetical protein BGW41_000840 [Actinomortierella wolfii]|nr:hypothetical protein BGW41_000840 [Actinomortierella wolfii]